MRSVRTPIFSKTACDQRHGNNPLITLRNASVMTVAALGVYVSQQHVRVVCKTLGQNHKKSCLTHCHLPPESQRQCSWNVAIRLKRRDFGFGFTVDETFFGRNGQYIFEYSRRSEPVVYPTEPEENSDIIICSNCSAYTWRPQSRP